MRSRLTITFGWLIAFVLSCDDPNYIPDYPQIPISEITSVSESGVTISGTFSESLFDEIVDYGAVWGPTPDLEIDTDFVQHQGKPSSTTWSIDVRADLLFGKRYFIRAFIVTAKNEIYGVPLKFSSQGSEGPVIEGISPRNVEIGTEVTINGKHFGDTTSTKVFFEKWQSKVEAEVVSINDDEIVVKYPFAFLDSSRVLIRKRENRDVRSGMWVKQRLPRILAVIVTDLCSSLEFVGQNLLLFGKPRTLTVNGVSLSTSAVTDNAIIVDHTFHTKRIHVEMGYSNGYHLSTGVPDPSRFPIVVDQTPETMPQSLTFTLEGNFPTCGGLDVEVLQGPTWVGPGYFKIIDVTAAEVTIKADLEVCESFKLGLKYNGDLIFTSNIIAPRPGCME